MLFQPDLEQTDGKRERERGGRETEERENKEEGETEEKEWMEKKMGKERCKWLPDRGSSMTERV